MRNIEIKKILEQKAEEYAQDQFNLKETQNGLFKSLNTLEQTNNPRLSIKNSFIIAKEDFAAGWNSCLDYLNSIGKLI